MTDSWESSEPYERFMGRWSRLVAQSFVQWLAAPSGLKWLDVGCGSGALSEGVIQSCAPSGVIAVDQSPGFVKSVQARLGNRVEARVGDARQLPVEDDAVDCTVSGLVLNFIPEPGKAVAEMTRVTASGGTMAVYVWDYAGIMEFLNHFWDAAVKFDSNAQSLHEGRRFPHTNPDSLTALFETAGLLDIRTAPITIETRFRDFDDYWQPFTGGQGPAPTYLMSSTEDERQNLRESVQSRLPIQPGGSIALAARAWAIRGTVP